MRQYAFMFLSIVLSAAAYGSDYATQIYAWNGDPAPVTNPANATLDPVYVFLNDNGDLLFTSLFGVEGQAPNFGVFVNKGGITRPVVVRGDWIPRSPAPVAEIQDQWIDQEGRVLVSTSWSLGKDLTLFDEEGVHDIVRVGQPLFNGGYAVKDIDSNVRFNNGRIAYIASFDTENDDDQGIYLDDHGLLFELGRSHTGSAPGASDAIPTFFRMPRLNFSADVFFIASFKAPEDGELIKLDGKSSDEGYFLCNGIEDRLIARRFQTLPGGKVLGTIFDASINAARQVAFIAHHTDNTYGVYVYSPLAGISLIMKTGDTVGGLTVATGAQGFMSSLQIADSGDILIVATVAGTTTFPNSDGIIRYSPLRGLELLAYETQIAPPPVAAQTFHYQHFARASINRDGVIAIDAVLQEKPAFDAITNHVIYIETPATHQMEVAATPGQAISHSQGADVLVRLNSFGGILEQPGPPVATGSSEDGGHSVFNASKIHVATIAARVRDGFGICTILPALVVNDVGDEADADLNDDLPDINPGLEGNQLTLRAAIQNANKRPGRDTIIFNIPSEQAQNGLFLIAVLTPLPEITEAVAIDGKTQSGYAGVPRISVDGGVRFYFEANQPASVSKGLVLKADKCSISGLALNQFPGPAIEAHETGYHVIVNNYVGLENTSELSTYGNRVGVLLDRSDGNIIEDNIISCNGTGIRIEGSIQLAGGRNEIKYNNIGTDSTGKRDRGNLFAGIEIQNGDNNVIAHNVIGWNAPEAVINSENITTPVGGIVFTGQDNAFFPIRNTVTENFIGVANDGATPIPNYNGVVVDAADEIDIGLFGKGNVISGNYDAGIKIENTVIPAAGMPDANVLPLAGFPSGFGFKDLPPLADAVAEDFPLTVQGNYIGTNAQGTAAVPNQRGVALIDGSAVFIDHNCISGNIKEGIEISALFGGARFNVVSHNIVGGTTGALTALPNENGILLHFADRNVIQFNTVVANKEVGIFLSNSQKNFTIRNDIGATLLGNKNAGIYCVNSNLSILGAGLFGDDIRENGNFGIYVENCSDIAIGKELIDKNAFGGVLFDDSTFCVVDGTVITNNKGAGIAVVGAGNNHFLPKSVEKNDGLSIDLLDNGVTGNDSNDADDGPNGLQNFPVLDSLVRLSAGDYFIAGRLDGLPNSIYAIDFFDTPDADPSRHGEGTTYFWTQIVITDASGSVRYTADPLGVGTLNHVSAIATPQLLRGPGSGTSEFSLSIQPIEIGVDLELTQTISPAPVKVNTPIEVNLTVTNKGISRATKVAIEGVLNPGFKISSFTSDAGAVGTRTAPAFAYEVGDLEVSGSANVKLILIPTKAGALTQVLNARSEIGDYNPGNNRVEVAAFAYSTDPASGNQPPSIPSGVSATPNPAYQFGPVAFEALASDPENQTLFFLWNFGDETDSVVTTTGQATHRYGDSGTFTVKLTCFDASGAATEATVIVFVTALGGAPGDNDGDTVMNPDDPDDDNDGVPDGIDADLDGDGVPNIVELEKGSNPNDKTSFPASEDGDNDGIPNSIDPDVDNDTVPNGTDPDIDGDGAANQDEQLAGTDVYNNTSKPGTLTISKFAASVRFDVTGKDTLQVTGQIPDISSGEVLAGKAFVFSAGNSTHRLVLDAKGKAKTPLVSVAVVKPKASKKTPNVIGPATFTMKAKGTLAATLLSGVSLNPVPATVPLKFVVRLSDHSGLATRNLTIAIKNGKTGQPASAKLGLPKVK